MRVHVDYDYYLDMGCEDVSHILGIQSMPPGYALMLDADGMYFFWFELETGRESAIFWNQWDAWRSAMKDTLRKKDKDDDGS